MKMLVSERGPRRCTPCSPGGPRRRCTGAWSVLRLSTWCFMLAGVCPLRGMAVLWPRCGTRRSLNWETMNQYVPSCGTKHLYHLWNFSKTENTQCCEWQRNPLKYLSKIAGKCDNIDTSNMQNFLVFRDETEFRSVKYFVCSFWCELFTVWLWQSFETTLAFWI